MLKWVARRRLQALLLAGTVLSVFNGCGLSDQQWASVWQQVITTGLNTAISTVLSSAAAGS